MFDGLWGTLLGQSEPHASGVISGYDFIGNNSVYVEGVRSGLGIGPHRLELVADELFGFITGV